MIKKIFAILIIVSLAACSTPNWYKPYGYFLFRQMPKEGTPGFELGWIHGCESGLATQYATVFYSMFYTWKRDPDIASSNPDLEKIRNRYKKELRVIDWNNIAEVKKNLADYNGIFWNAHAFCRHSSLGILQTAGVAPKLPGEDRYNMQDPGNNIGGVYRMNARGDSRIGNGFW